MKDAMGFFRDSRMPDGFHRTDLSKSGDAVGNFTTEIFAAHPTQPGKNNGAVNSFTVDPNSATLNDRCKLYESFVNNKVVPLYPNPQGVLRDNLKVNLNFLFRAFPECTQVFPYGQ